MADFFVKRTPQSPINTGSRLQRSQEGRRPLQPTFLLGWYCSKRRCSQLLHQWQSSSIPPDPMIPQFPKLHLV